MLPLPHDDVKVTLAPGLCVADARLQDRLCLVDELAVQVDGVGGDAVDAVVLAEDVGGGLGVVGGGGGLVAFAFEGKGGGGGARGGGVGLVCLWKRGVGGLFFVDGGGGAGGLRGRSMMPFCRVRCARGRVGGRILLLHRSFGSG